MSNCTLVFRACIIPQELLLFPHPTGMSNSIGLSLSHHFLSLNCCSPNNFILQNDNHITRYSSQKCSPYTSYPVTQHIQLLQHHKSLPTCFHSSCYWLLGCLAWNSLTHADFPYDSRLILHRFLCGLVTFLLKAVQWVPILF